MSATAARTAAAPPVGVRAVMGNRHFAIYVMAAFVSNVGSFMQTIGVAFVLRRITGQDAWVGGGVFASFIPSLLVGPLAGPFCDRFDRRHILLWANAVQAVAAIGLCALSVADALTPWRMVGLLVLAGIGGGFQYAAAQALVALLVPAEHLLPAVRIYAVGFNSARAIGPAIAGIALGVWGPTTTFALNAASFGVVLVGLFLIRPRRAPRSATQGSVRAEFVAGVRYSWRHRSMELCMYTALAVTLFGASVAQLAAGVAADVFDVGGTGLGLLVGSYGVGSAVAALTLTVVAERYARSRVALAGVFLYGTGVLLVVATRHMPVGMLGYFAMGISHILVGISTNTTIQSQVDESFRGRVMSLYLMCMVAGMPIGALVGGRLGDRFGLRRSLGGFGVTLLVYGLIGVVWLRSFAAFDDDAAIAKDPARS